MRAAALLAAAGAVVVLGACSPASTSTAGTATAATSATGPAPTTAAPSASRTTTPTVPTSPAPTASPGASTSPATLPPPPVVDLCAAFDQQQPTLRETASPGSATTRGQVAALQRGLKRLGFDPGPVDGWFGPSTTRAVTAFQRDAGLPADGVVGPRTWSVWFIDACGID